MRELLAHKLGKTLVIEASSRRDDDVSGIEESAVVVEQHRLFKLSDGLLCSQYRLTERVILPKVLGKNLVDQIVWTIFVHLDFFEDHSAFPDDILRRENRVKDQICHDVHRDRQMFIEDLDVEADALFCSERIHVAAD